ncbi:MAG: transcriptional repressor [Prevotellaceae bacterium]|jgi:Fe2+ or Zn2+ uptake regulation protein|nr:transcriptional repressor [Prevotellaceae bacterium]
MKTTNTAAERLNQCGIKPSHQRLMIMSYLLTHYTHPCADTVYSSLVARMPTLSKTTVYNTLRLFARHGAALELSIDEKCLRFDGVIQPHVHFMCKECGSIYDIPLGKKNVPTSVPKKFVVTESQLYLKGLCEGCAGKKRNAA